MRIEHTGKGGAETRPAGEPDPAAGTWTGRAGKLLVRGRRGDDLSCASAARYAHRVVLPDDTAADPGRPALGHVQRFVGDEPRLRFAELASRAGVSEHRAQVFWRAMGFPDVDPQAVVFAEADVRALADMARLVDDGVIDEQTFVSLVRAQGYMADRLVLWQVEALVDDEVRTTGVDDTTAREHVLRRLTELHGLLEGQLRYAWRRQLAALADRSVREIAERPAGPADPDALPLPRALGFVDMVSYTSRSARLGSEALAALVQTFDHTVRDVITSHGARVVKTIGDAVLYIADELPTAASVAVDLVDAVGSRPELMPVRGSLVWGRVVSRSGDVFGPVVNLAARLADIADAGQILVDPATAELLGAGATPEGLTLVPKAEATLQGIGSVRPVELRKA